MAQQQEQQQFRCTGDCASCRAINDRKLQWLYCATQHSHDNMMLLQRIEQRLNDMENHFAEVSKKVESIQDNETQVFNPNDKTEEPKPIAQEGEGAEE